MNTRYFVLSILCIYFTLTPKLFAQTSEHLYKGVVVNNKTKEIISFVGIISKITNYGTYSNEEGRFQINLSNKKDTLWLSCIGYKSKGK